MIRAKQILRSIFFDGLKINKTLLLINMGTVGSERRMLMRRSAAAAHRSAPPPTAIGTAVFVNHLKCVFEEAGRQEEKIKKKGKYNGFELLPFVQVRRVSLCPSAAYFQSYLGFSHLTVTHPSGICARSDI